MAATPPLLLALLVALVLSPASAGSGSDSRRRWSQPAECSQSCSTCVENENWTNGQMGYCSGPSGKGSMWCGSSKTDGDCINAGDHCTKAYRASVLSDQCDSPAGYNQCGHKSDGSPNFCLRSEYSGCCFDGKDNGNRGYCGSCPTVSTTEMAQTADRPDPFTSAQKQDLISLVNGDTYRGGLTAGTIPGQPQATNMQTVTWDEDLAKVAQAYSETCNWAHNGARSTQYAAAGGSGQVGENIAVGTGSYSYTNALAGWWAEHADYTFSGNSCASGAVCGHYTQMAWASSSRIGCGMTKCASMTGLSFSDAEFVVCDYAPAGNYVGQSPYASTGSPAPTPAPSPAPSPAPAPAPSPSPSGSCTNIIPDATCTSWYNQYKSYGCDRVSVSFNSHGNQGGFSGTLATVCAQACGCPAGRRKADIKADTTTHHLSISVDKEGNTQMTAVPESIFNMPDAPKSSHQEASSSPVGSIVLVALMAAVIVGAVVIYRRRRDQGDFEVVQAQVEL